MTTSPIERWDIFELALAGPQSGNPFLDVQFGARFSHGHRTVDVEGFYDGEGLYRVRLMPDAEGEWAYVTRSNVAELDGQRGAFTCASPSPGNRGPLQVRGTYHLAYADGMPHFSFGTTCYAWIHQPPALQEQTLATLRGAPFNKLRMCVFPKDYAYSKNEPELYPFERAQGGGWDFSRPNPAFFRHLERRVDDLRTLGIEADIILFHPYDRWGFARMDEEADHRYLRYTVARLAAYRNVWWSLANEFNIMPKDSTVWDRFFKTVQESDPYGHMRSVHNWVRLEDHRIDQFYDFTRPWVTHCSIQHAHTDMVDEWRALYRKPVIVDEACYEGDLPNGWGNLSAQEMVRRFWEAMVHGGYCGHGETYLDPQDIIWWSKGGALKGDSPPRIAFLRQIVEEGGLPLDPLGQITNTHLPSAGRPGQVYLTYLGVRQPGQVTFRLPEESRYQVHVLDTWEMTATPHGTFGGTFTLRLPGKPYLAVWIVRCD